MRRAPRTVEAPETRSPHKSGAAPHLPLGHRLVARPGGGGGGPNEATQDKLAMNETRCRTSHNRGVPLALVALTRSGPDIAPTASWSARQVSPRSMVSVRPERGIHHRLPRIKCYPVTHVPTTPLVRSAPLTERRGAVSMRPTPLSLQNDRHGQTSGITVPFADLIHWSQGWNGHGTADRGL